MASCVLCKMISFDVCGEYNTETAQRWLFTETNVTVHQSVHSSVNAMSSFYFRMMSSGNSGTRTLDSNLSCQALTCQVTHSMVYHYLTNFFHSYSCARAVNRHTFCPLSDTRVVPTIAPVFADIVVRNPQIRRGEDSQVIRTVSLFMAKHISSR